MSKRGGTSRRFGRCMKAPVRALCRARDLYVRSMNSCAGRMEYGPPLGCPHFEDLPRSYGLQSAGDEDLRELMRAASRSLGTLPPPAVPRSQSVAVGRIDEDKPCDFGEVAVGADLLLPRSRSHDPGAKRKARLFV
ncbi:unnamed protein product [Musa acuminata subsp. burmannicoides]|uniref:(wild Malaysian banana) hypothetical protein n=1 Tax=Musa acuminata subsp. malaccensis TaxID=214687 RepID=A0A804IYP5_MUSAM|nr:PREDICTED: uncharacterized protein LOC103983301 [Musa acuminata subsp. malaccensis]CAG1844690.1 unnamed protein product [Musa acuminata subsp. malaccensis]